MGSSIRFRNVMLVLASLAIVATLGLGMPGAARADLIAYFPMNEGTGTTTTDTVSGLVGTLTAGGGHSPAWTASGGGHTGLAGDDAVQMQGYQDRIVANGTSISSLLAVSGDFTVSMWAKASSLGTYPYLIEMSNDTTGNSRQWFVQTDSGGSDSFYVWSDANGNWKKGLGFHNGSTIAGLPDKGSGANKFNESAWNDYTFVYTKSTGQFQSYIDGVLASTVSIGAGQAMPGFTSLQIGGSGKAAYDSFEGSIDNVVILNKAATSSDVTAIMNGSYSGMSAVPEPSTFALLGVGVVGLIGYWWRRRTV
jgi:hypothetical protein